MNTFILVNNKYYYIIIVILYFIIIYTNIFIKINIINSIMVQIKYILKKTIILIDISNI